MGRDDVHNRWRRVEEHTAVLCALWTWGSGEAFIRVPLTFGEIGSFGRVTTSRSGPQLRPAPPEKGREVEEGRGGGHQG